MSGVGAVQIVFLLLLLFVVALGVLAIKLRTPYPIVMVVGGLILSFLPGIPRMDLNPDLIFLVVLPPLLYSSAWTTSWRDFRYNLVSILLLAFGLVGFTVLGVALAAPTIFAGFDWRLGLLLGAIVAPTDAIAATAIARRVGLPARIVDILEGESLINDASGLLALQFSTSIIVDRHIPTVSEGFLTLLWLIVGGILIGLLVGWLVDIFERWIDDGPIEIALSILVPYAVYLTANSVQASGVLAVVACGLFLSRRSANFFSPSVRIQIWSVWQSLTFILNGFVFVLIGLQLPAIHASIHRYSTRMLILYGVSFSILLILLRLVWTFPGARIAFFVRTHFLHQNVQRPPRRQIFVVGWIGMRGVVSLAAALALPMALKDGSPFPQRELIVFLTFCVIVVTLPLQGITLPPLLRTLGLVGADSNDCEEREARRLVVEAAVSHLERAREHDTDSLASELYEDISHHYRQRLAGLASGGIDAEESAGQQRYVSVSLETIRVERQAAISLRNQGRINDDVLRRIEYELDLNESRLLTLNGQ
jgi:monovalent cation/hydrogen antiporter